MPIYSHSRLNTYETCPLQYKLQYLYLTHSITAVDKNSSKEIPEPPTIGFFTNYSGKIKGHHLSIHHHGTAITFE
ncbi:MAG: hypothetical protein AABZ28_07825 [Nitrospinota bacterium]